MDIWEADARVTHLAPHSCNTSSLYPCSGAECGSSGVCAKVGCTQDPYRLNKEYYGPGLKVDTKRPFTVVTQFPATNGTLTAVRRLYVQDGIIVQNVVSDLTGAPAVLDQEYYSKNSPEQYNQLGGTMAMYLQGEWSLR